MLIFKHTGAAWPVAVGMLLFGLGWADAAETQAPRVPDTIAQRTLACTVCHGKQGRATNAGYFPRIAGKPAQYLYRQLINFREGRRTYPAMTTLVDHLSDAYLYEIAEYFADLRLPYPATPQTLDAPASVLARGQALALRGDTQHKIAACAACHGSALTGEMPATPGLLGLPRDYLLAQLGAWQNGKRRANTPDCMAQVAQRLSVDDVSAVATWLSAQPLPANTLAALPGTAPRPLDCGHAPP